MDTPEKPQIYLITPPEIELGTFPDRLASVLDAHPVACVRLALSTRDEDRLSRAADALRDVTHTRDVALVISDHLLMVERLGLDGVHLNDAARSVRHARKELGEDAIVGSFCGPSSTKAWPPAKRAPITSASAPCSPRRWATAAMRKPPFSNGGPK